MALRLKHNDLSRNIAGRIVELCYNEFAEHRIKYPGKKTSRDLNADARDEWCRQVYGLSINYLKQIRDGAMDEPSTRVLRLLEIEVYYKDPVTGEMQQAEIPTTPRDANTGWGKVNARRRETEDA